MLTIHESILKDQEMDIDGHLHLVNEARTSSTMRCRFQPTIWPRGVDRVLADLKLKIMKKLDEEQLSVAASEAPPSGSLLKERSWQRPP